MKSKFPGYFKLSQNQINELWKSCIFTFDANILLNLYRYSDETREEFIKILNKLEGRIWLPHQSGQEFFNNRLGVINKQEKSYDSTIAALNKIAEEFNNSRQHPFISAALLRKFTKLNEEIKSQLKENKEFHTNRIFEDDILNKIAVLFEKNIGDELSYTELTELYKEGESRYKDKIPPGYKDSNKSEDGIQNNKFGDLIVWKQIITKSIKSKKNVILVTDDRKEDWWLRFNGKTISPHPELIKEFSLLAGQSFHMYQSDRFLEFARDYLKEEVNEKVIEEIRDLRKLDERRRLNSIQEIEDIRSSHKFNSNFDLKLSNLEMELQLILRRKRVVQDNLINLYQMSDNSNGSEDINKDINRYKNDFQQIEVRSKELKREIAILNDQRNQFYTPPFL